MNFLTPLALGLAALSIPIIVLYLLRRRREEREVSSTLLWMRMVRDLEANAPWQRLQRHLLLFLQLLALLLLTLAAARPFIRVAGESAETVVVVLDTSLSMAAADTDDGTRFESAKRAVLNAFDQMPTNGRLTLLTAGITAQLRLANSHDRLALQEILDTFHPTDPDSNLTPALLLAGATVARQPNSRIIVVSDGAVRPPDTPITLSAPVAFVRVGSRGDNAGIAIARLERAQNETQLYVQVRAFGETESARRIVVESVDGTPLAAFEVVAPPNGYADHTFALPAVEAVHVRLSPTDFYPLDDEAWAVLPAADRRRVRLVTQGNIFLQTALALLPGVETEVVPLDADLSNAAPADLTILDAGWQGEALPEGNLFVIAPMQSTPPITVTGALSLPVAAPATANDPLLAYVDLDDLAILDGVATALPPWARPVLIDRASGAPLLWLGEENGRAIGLLAFDLHHSDLPLRVAFPVLIANLVDALTTSRADVPASTVVGRPLRVQVPPTISAVPITLPNGRTTTLEPRNGAITFTPQERGIYRMQWGDEETAFAVNAFTEQESNLAPAESLRVGITTDGAARPLPAEEGRREVWRWLALAAFAVLVLEWLIAHRDAWRLRRVGKWGWHHHRS